MPSLDDAADIKSGLIAVNMGLTMEKILKKY